MQYALKFYTKFDHCRYQSLRQMGLKAGVDDGHHLLFHERLTCQPMLPCNFHKNLSSLIQGKVSYLDRKVHVSEVLRPFSELTQPLKICLRFERIDSSNFK